MPDHNEPQGCLSAILKLFGVNLSGKQSTVELPYRIRDDFLSAAELMFYRVLKQAVPEEFTICTKVNLADIFFVTKPNENRGARNKIDRKHVDFLLCHTDSMRPALGIELDDSSHSRRDRQERDQFVDSVFAAAGLPLLRVPAKSKYSVQELAEQIHQAVGTGTLPREQPASVDGNRACPKCGAEMVLRTAKKGERKGQQFWGCSNYPKCRSTAEV